MALSGNNLLVRRYCWWLTCGYAKHARNTRAQHVCIDKSDTAAELVEHQGEIDADCGLPYAALATTHRDHVADPRQLVGIGSRLG